MPTTQATLMRQAVVVLSALPKPQRTAILQRLTPPQAAAINQLLDKTAAFDTAEFHCAVRQFIQSSQRVQPVELTSRSASRPPTAANSNSIPNDSGSSDSPLPREAKDLIRLFDELTLERCLELLQGEDASFVAAVLFLVSAKRCAEIIQRMELSHRTRVLLDLSSIAEIPPETVEHVRRKLLRKLEFGASLHARSEGMHRVRQILEHLDPSLQGTIADSLASSDPRLAAELHRNVFRFNDLLRMTRGDVKKLLPHVDPSLWGPALRHADERVRKHIFAAMPSDAVKRLRHELEVLQNLAIDQSTAPQQQIVQVAQELFRNRIIARPSSDFRQSSAA